MPEIGQTLRETRMRNRIDITEVEAGTKIRAKYLRALENEEWDLLPGPTFVKTFLRSYADYLGLDSRQLVEEYKQRFERPSTMELTPFSPRAGARGGRRERRRRAILGPGLVVVFVLVLVLGALYALGSWGEEDPGGEREANTVETPTPTPKSKSKRKKKRAEPTRVTLQIVPTGLVSVCLVDANGRALIDNRALAPGDATRRYRGKRFRVSFGNGQARMRTGGRTIDVPDRSTPVGYEVRPGKTAARAVRGAQANLHVRAGILITGTEVLSGIISDRNGPWLSERLREQGVEVAEIVVVADRRDDMLEALRFMAGLDLVVTSGGLGPTADDLTAEVVAEFAGRPLALDSALEERIWAILERLRSRWRNLDETAMRASNRKQAMVPDGATVLEPVGTAPGLVVPGPPVVLVLPGPPRELQPMWATALQTDPMRELLAQAGTFEQRIMRLFGIPESEIARSLREIEADGVPIDQLEITTCLRRGEIEIATVFEPPAAEVYEAFEAAIRERHADTLFSEDGSTIDDQVIALMAGRTVAVAESCTGGLMSARLTDRGGSSEYMVGGLVVYSNAAKTALAGVPAELIEAHGAVSPEVAAALADGAIDRFGAEVGIGITGIAGPGGGTEEKPVGTVCLSVALAGGERWDRSVLLPGDRLTIRERTTTVVMHGLRRLLREAAAVHRA